MHDATSFGWIVLAYAAVGPAAVLSDRLSERLRLPTPALFLAAAARQARAEPAPVPLCPRQPRLALTFVIRPAVISLCLAKVELSRNELAFVLWSGLKGAVPVLLGSFLLVGPVPEAPRLYGVVVVVVVFSVVVQGGLVPYVAGRLHIRMHQE